MKRGHLSNTCGLTGSTPLVCCAFSCFAGAASNSSASTDLHPLADDDRNVTATATTKITEIAAATSLRNAASRNRRAAENSGHSIGYLGGKAAEPGKQMYSM
eukprot:15330-Rhodomonas_salina.2